jgi:hypothetical protein
MLLATGACGNHRGLRCQLSVGGSKGRRLRQASCRGYSHPSSDAASAVKSRYATPCLNRQQSTAANKRALILEFGRGRPTDSDRFRRRAASSCSNRQQAITGGSEYRRAGGQHPSSTRWRYWTCCRAQEDAQAPLRALRSSEFIPTFASSRALSQLDGRRSRANLEKL